jgi:hypothetical protein
VIVDVARLLASLKRLLWRHGMVRPELLRHEVHADGSHTISLTLESKDVTWTPPKYLERPGLGSSTPGGADGKVKS